MRWSANMTSAILPLLACLFVSTAFIPNGRSHIALVHPPHVKATGRFDGISRARHYRRHIVDASTTASSPQDNVNDSQNLNLQHDDSTTSPINMWWKPMIAICVPAWVGMMADPVLSMMDTAFVGRLGSVELAALGACTSIFHLAFNAFRATTAATTTLVAAAESKEEQKKVIQVSMALGFVLGWGVLGVLQFGGPWFLARMGVPATSALYKPALQYLTARAWAGPAVLGLVVAEGAFRGFGDTKIPLVASLFAAAINLVLDPILIFSCGLGVTGAAAATAMSQFGAFGVYLYFLRKRDMLPRRRDQSTKVKVKARHVIMTILGANVSMLAKQASLLLAWAFATSKATRLGKEQVAAHQVALSFWLIFALWLDGSAVAAQVLASQVSTVKSKMRSLTKFALKIGAAQGVISMAVLFALGPFVPTLFTTDAIIRHHIGLLVPHLAVQQLLISMTLVVESLVAGGQQFSLLAWGTLFSTIVAVQTMQSATNVEQIWYRGINLLFAGRLLSSLLGLARINGIFSRSEHGVAS
jgi:putative MATE family efflux protein